MEFPFDVDYFVNTIAFDDTIEKKLLKFISMNKNINLYSPIKINGKKIIEGFIDEESQKERLDVLPTDFNNETILDLGCGNGYMLFEIEGNRNCGICHGVDIDMAQILLGLIKANYEGGRVGKVNFIHGTITEVFEAIFNGKMQTFDNIISFGLYTHKDRIEENIFRNIALCAKKRVFIEFANYSWCHKTKKEWINYSELFHEFGDVKVTFLKYQERPVFEITLNKDTRKKPIVLSLQED
jgi:SAM-dependent methyltransferase